MLRCSILTLNTSMWGITVPCQGLTPYYRSSLSRTGLWFLCRWRACLLEAVASLSHTKLIPGHEISPSAWPQVRQLVLLLLSVHIEGVCPEGWMFTLSSRNCFGKELISVGEYSSPKRSRKQKVDQTKQIKKFQEMNPDIRSKSGLLDTAGNIYNV